METYRRLKRMINEEATIESIYAERSSFSQRVPAVAKENYSRARDLMAAVTQELRLRERQRRLLQSGEETPAKRLRLISKIEACLTPYAYVPPASPLPAIRENGLVSQAANVGWQVMSALQLDGAGALRLVRHARTLPEAEMKRRLCNFMEAHRPALAASTSLQSTVPQEAPESTGHFVFTAFAAHRHSTLYDCTMFTCL